MPVAYPISRFAVRPDRPIGGWRPARRAPMLEIMLLELAVIALSVVGFVLLDYYVLGCEKV
ncbi:MAG: hypothetical protein JOY98_12665 [Candidatus Eremiobacteraeota bacterium]|nr:hypothetical protein [Candidatus Eremiobacteraeota bacterium]